MKKLFIFPISIALSFSQCNLDNEVLATYTDGNILRKEIRELADAHNVGDRAKNSKWQKQTIKRLAVRKILKKKIDAKNLEKNEEVQKKLAFVKRNAAEKSLRNRWEKKQDEIPEKLYYIHTILFREAFPRPKPNQEQAKESSQSKPSSKKNQKNIDSVAKKEEKTLVEEEKEPETSPAEKNTLKLREKIMKESLDFAEAVQIQDKEIKSKGQYRNMGYNALNTLTPQLALAALRLSGKLKGKFYRIKRDETPIYESPDTSSNELTKLHKGVIVNAQANSAATGGWQKILYLTNTSRGILQSGYISSNAIKAQPKEKKNISYPLRTYYGWQLVHLEEIYSADKEDLIEILTEQRNAKIRGDKKKDNFDGSFYWRRVITFRRYAWENNIYQKHGLFIFSLPKLEEDWEKKDILLEKKDLKLTKNDFIEYVKLSYNNNEKLWEDLKKNLRRLNLIFNRFTKIQILSSHALKNKIEQSKEYQKLYTAEKYNYLLEKYFEDEYLKAEAEKEKAAKKIETAIKPDAQKKETEEEIRRREQREKRLYARREERKVLTENNFKINDDKIEDNKL